mgnify:CR=1 FL=1
MCDKAAEAAPMEGTSLKYRVLPFCDAGHLIHWPGMGKATLCAFGLSAGLCAPTSHGRLFNQGSTMRLRSSRPSIATPFFTSAFLSAVCGLAT